MEINDIIDMQSDATTESTLESEIDALSKIITDTKDNIKKLGDSDDDFKLDNDDLSFATSLQSDTVERDKCELLPNNSLTLKGILCDGVTSRANCTSLIKSYFQETSETSKLVDNTPEEIYKDNEPFKKIQNSETFALSSKDFKQPNKNHNILNTELYKSNNSLSLINEAYSSQESQIHLENQSDIEVVESKNVSDIKIIDNLNSDIEGVDKNHNDTIEVNVSDSVTDICTNVDKLIEKFDATTTESFVSENSSKEMNEIKCDEKSDFTIKYLNLNDTKEKNYALNIHQIDKDTNKMMLEINSSIKTEKRKIEESISNTHQINTTKETNDFIKPFIDKESKTESANTVDDKSMKEKFKQYAIEGQTCNTKETIKCIKESAENDGSTLILKDVLEINKKQTVTIVENIEKNIEVCKLLKDKEKVKIPVTEKTITLESSLITSKNNQQTNLQLEKLNEIDKQETANIFEEIGISSNTEIKIKSNKITMENVVEIADIEILTEQNIENLNSNVDVSIHTSQDMQKNEIDFMNKIDTVNVKPLQNIKNLENLELIEHSLLQESKLVNTNESSKEIENIQDIIHAQSFKNTDTGDNALKGLNSLESIKQDSEIITKNFKSKSVIPTIEIQPINEMKNKSDKTILSDELFSTENCNTNLNIKNEIDKNIEEKNILQMENNLFINIESQNIEISNQDVCVPVFKNLLEPENINNPVEAFKNNELKQIHDQSTIQNSSLILNKETTKIRSDNFSARLEPQELEIFDKIHQITIGEVQKLQLKSEVKIEKESIIKINTHEKLIENEKKLIDKIIKDDINNLSFNPNECDLTDSQCLSTEQIELKNSLNELIFNENCNNDEIKNTSEIVEPDLSVTLDMNKKVHKIISNEGLNSQDLTAGQNINKKEDFINFENPNLCITADIQSPDENKKKSVSMLDIKTESIPNENIVAMINISNQSPNQLQNDKLINDLYSSCATDNSIEKDIEFENNKNLKESILITEQYKENNIKDKKMHTNIINSDIFIDFKENLQTNLKNKSSCSTETQTTIESTETSKLKSSIKNSQESEEQKIDSIVIDENIINDENSSIFVSVDENICSNVSENLADLQEVNDPIAISEPKIISESTKLHTDHKKKIVVQEQPISSMHKLCNTKNINIIKIKDSANNLISEADFNKKLNLPEVPNIDISQVALSTKNKMTSESLLTVPILEECYKESSNYENLEICSKIDDITNSQKTNLFFNNDSTLRGESLEKIIKNTETKLCDTSKKDSDRQQQQQYSECENIGSPRIILKIAKSAITECSEPRSPKSPKIRSATNSPNPEDNSGHKLGKIKLKLSKSGHPSIIPSTDNYDETAQWHADNMSSLSTSGMKIKLTKSADVSAIDYKHDETQKQDELQEKNLYKTEEIRKAEASIGMKIKLLKSGDGSIVQQEINTKDAIVQELSNPKKQDSPLIGMKIKLSKFGDASIVQQDKIQYIHETASKYKDKIIDDIQDHMRHIESSFGMKVKQTKSDDSLVITNEPTEFVKEILDLKTKSERIDPSKAVKIKLAKIKDGVTSIITNENIEETRDKFEITETTKKTKFSKKRDVEITEIEEIESNTSKQQEQNKPKISKITINTDACSHTDSSDDVSKGGIGMKIKLLKSGDASVVHTKIEELPMETIHKGNEQPIGMKIKLSKTGDPSIIHSEIPKESEESSECIITKQSKNKDYSSIIQPKIKDDTHFEVKIKLSKTSHPTIIAANEIEEDSLKIMNSSLNQSQKQKDHIDFLTLKESTPKAFKNNYSDISIETTNTQLVKNAANEAHNKRKDITIAPIESKTLKIDTNFKEILPEITIQPIIPVVKQEAKQLVLESNSEMISKQQMNAIKQEISITQVCSLATGDSLKGERLKNTTNVQSDPSNSSSLASDCEIIEPQPELIIVNENSNSSQDIMIIDEIPSHFTTKLPKKRGRPRRNATTTGLAVTNISSFQETELQKDPLSLEQMPTSMPIPMSMPLPLSMSMSLPNTQYHMQLKISGNTEGTERPRRTCRSQKSYAPPKRGRGRGRGKRKHEIVNIPLKKQRIEQDFADIENTSTTAIALEKFSVEANVNNSPELFKALNQPICITKQMKEVDELKDLETSQMSSMCEHKIYKEDQHNTSNNEEIIANMTSLVACKNNMDESAQNVNLIAIKVTQEEEKQSESTREQIVLTDQKDSVNIQEHQNWLTPSIKKVPNESAVRNESISTLAVIDEETRMSAESSSRSQTPARSMIVPGTAETLVNEESQGSVLSTATTESEKVKVKNRRMEISFDPDEGPFTVEKIAEYEWPLEKKDERPATGGETFMIQEQISQYLGVKSFKRKYPDLKRRMVDMEERNFLRENGLVSESMCDMGLTAVSSSEVLDIMCSDFPEQYEEYRKHMREKAAKEHSKKQKELSAAANAERNRIDLAEMAMQSAVSWNSCLNKARLDSRKCSLDLQTFTVHMPKRQIKLDLDKKISHYPVALIPGQYTDYYREYTTAELRYYPLNTVLYGPMRPNERKFDSRSEGSQSDTDTDSSSDDSSSSSSEGTQDTEGSQSTVDDVDMDLALQPNIKCKICLNDFNKNNRPEVLIQCGTCNGNVHPSCIDLTLDMVPHIRAYAWQCTDCKTCAQCHDPADEDKMLFCDMCDRGYHIYCVGLRRVPQGRWHCQECAICANCGSKEPGGINSDRNSVAQWQHEYKKGEKNLRVYISTFCVPCSKLWRKGRYCPHCSCCHNASRLDLEVNLVQCRVCGKYLHLGCAEAKGQIIDKKNYFCEFCSPHGQQLVKSLISKICV